MILTIHLNADDSAAVVVAGITVKEKTDERTRGVWGALASLDGTRARLRWLDDPGSTVADLLETIAAQVLDTCQQEPLF